MRLAGIWTVFNGLELLEASVELLRPYLDEVIILTQDVSWHGHKGDVVPSLDAHYVEYKCNTRLNPKINEKKKHTLGVTEANRLGCSHFIMMACDHFYEPKQFKRAKESFTGDSSVTKMVTYYKTPDWMLDPLESYYCPFINRIDKSFCFGDKYPVYVDPALQYSPNKNFRLYPQDELVLHHLSWARSEKEIRSKIDNAASRQNWKDKSEILLDEWINFDPDRPLSYYPNHKLVKTDPVFLKKNEKIKKLFYN